ncbi:hypothetical protein QQ045_023509 [Rhodiola kirilowii]
MASTGSALALMLLLALSTASLDSALATRKFLQGSLGGSPGGFGNTGGLGGVPGGLGGRLGGLGGGGLPGLGGLVGGPGGGLVGLGNPGVLGGTLPPLFPTNP